MNNEFQEIAGFRFKDIKARPVNSIEEMKETPNLVAGNIIKTIGFYEANDGGGATYLIRGKTSDDVENGFIHFINENIVAEMIIENNRINIKQLGAKSQDINNNKYDIKPYIQLYLNKLNELQNRLILYIPSGIWYCSALEILNEYGFNIEGNEQWQLYAGNGTTITSYEDNQTYIFKVGSSNQMVNNFAIKNITFSSGDYLYFENGNNFRVPDENTKNIDTALVLHYAGFGIFENVNFNHIIGEIMSITSSWEMRFNKINCSYCSNINDGLIIFKSLDTSLNEAANISNIEILELNFEAVNGNLIKCEQNCGLIDSVINNLHFEPFTCLLENTTQHEFTDGIFNAETIKHLALIDINGGCKLIINNIILNNMAFRYLKNNDVQYVYDTIFNITNTNKYQELQSVVNNIMVQGMKRNLNLVLQETEENTIKSSSSITVNNILNTTAFHCIYNVKYFPTIINNAILKNTRNQMRSLINNSFNAFCDYTRNADNDNRRYLYYDANALNNSLLAVKPITNKTSIFCNSSMLGTKIYIRGKIENGKTYTMTVAKPDYSQALNFNLVGTGAYKLYELDMTPIIDGLKDNPSLIFYSANTQTEEIDVSLDYFYFE